MAWRLRPRIFLAASKPRRPPPSVVFTDWLWTTAADGHGCRPRRSRSATTSPWLIRANMALFWLPNEAWATIEPHLPKNQPRARRVDDRRVISGIPHVLKVGCRWRDCPAEYGPSTTVYNRFNRWSHLGFWLKLLDPLEDAGAVTKSTAIDSTYVKAQRAAFGAKGGRSAARVAAGRPKSTRSPTSSAAPMP
jgi:transposase